MIREGLGIEQIDVLPNPSRYLPEDKLFIRLGCLTCPNQVCLEVDGTSGLSLKDKGNSPAEDDLRDAICGVNKQLRLNQIVSTRWGGEPCKEPCPEEDNIWVALELINERFQGTLRSNN